MPGSGAALQSLFEEGLHVVFVTNNSTRSPKAAADKIERLTGVSVDPDHICTSAQAAATVLGDSDGPVLVVGEDGIHDAIAGKGLEVTSDASAARSVVVGLDRGFGYEDIANAAEAIRNGARFIATNADATYPTEDGVKPGSGSIVAAIAAVAGRPPEVCGKPHPPMRALVQAHGVTDAWVIGDRVDTDIALADDEPEWRSILVLSGVTGPDDPTGDADHVVADFAAAVDVVLAAHDKR